MSSLKQKVALGMRGAFYNFGDEEVPNSLFLLALRFLLVVEWLHHLINAKGRRTLALRESYERSQKLLEFHARQ